MATTLTPTEEKTDCFRLLSLVIDGGTLVLRYRFDQSIPPADLHNKLSDANIRGKLYELRRGKVITQVQWELLYPKTGQPNSSNFDISLLVCLLRYICGLNEQSNAWNCIPPSFDTSIEADITRLRLLRNEMLHMKYVSITKQDFQTKWNEMEQVILRLGTGLPNLQDDIQNLKENSIDTANELMYRNIIQEWERQDKSLQLEVEGIKTELKDCVKESQQTKASVTESNTRLDEIDKHTMTNSKQIEKIDQKQQRETICVDRLSSDLAKHENKITRTEERQDILEHNIQEIREKCDKDSVTIYRRRDALASNTDDLTTSVRLVQSKDGEVSSELKHLASMAKMNLEDSALDNVYVRTHLHDLAKAKLLGSGCVILSGLPGEGKTTMATELIAEIGKAGSCLKLQEPSDWKVVDLSETQYDTLFIDDIFGAGVLNEALLSGWSRFLPDIEKAVKKKILYVVITTRHYILEEAKEKMHRLYIFQNENVQMLASADLISSERAEILEAHLKNAEKEFNRGFVQECNTAYEKTFSGVKYDTPTEYFPLFQRGKGKYINAMVGFPEIASLFVSNDHLFKKGASFFEEPLTFFKKCMEDLFLYKKKFLALLLIWTRPDYVLNIKDLEPPETSTEIKTTAKMFGFRLKGERIDVLRESLKYHQNGYIQHDTKTGNYTFCHNIIKDMVGLVAGQQYPEAVLQFASEEFLIQYITVDQTKNDGFHVVIEEHRFPKLNAVICKTFRKNRPPVRVTPTEEKPSFIYDMTDEEVMAFTLKAMQGMHKLVVTGAYTPLRDLPMSIGEDEINVSMLQHDCFRNRVFVNLFLKSTEGKAILPSPVITFSEQFGYYGIDFGKRDLHVFLPTRALLNNNSILLEEFLKQAQHPYFGNSEEFLCLCLLTATHQEMQDVVNLLLLYGSQITEDAVLIAAEKKDTNMLCFLLRHPGYEHTAKSHIINKNSPLMSATKRGNVRAVKCLLQHGVDINYRNKKGLSALDKATFCINRTEVCRVLLENGAEINCKTPRFKRTPLHTVADIGEKHMTELLLQHGASMHIKDYRGHYPIHCAAIRGHISIVEILLKADSSQAKLKITSYGTESAIKGMDLVHIAVWKNNVELLDLLLQQNVNPNTRDYYGRTSIYCAVYKIFHGKNSEHEEAKNLEIINKLLKVANANIADKDDHTPLHAAIHRGNTEVAKLICPFANVNARDKYGKAPLHTACEKENIEMIKTLINQHRADVRMFTKNGQSIMHIVLGKFLNREYAVAPRLIKHMPRHVLLKAEQAFHDYPPWAEIKHIVENNDPDFATNWVDLECRFASGKFQHDIL